MASCNCGGKKVKVTKAKPKKVAAKKPQGKVLTSDRAKRLSAQATKAATKAAKNRPNPYAKGCKCSQ